MYNAQVILRKHLVFYVACNKKFKSTLLTTYVHVPNYNYCCFYAAYSYYKHFTDFKRRVSILVSITYLVELSLSNCFNTYSQIIVLL